MVSVILPVYNGQNYLAAAIESILGQTYTDYELIIIDDGSSDSTKEIVLSYSDSRIKYFYQENRGLSISLNRGIEYSQYEYIARMDADDIALPQRLEMQITYLKDNPNIDLVGGQMHAINADGDFIGYRHSPVGEENIGRYIKFGCPVFHSTYLVRKYVYKSLSGYRNLKTAQDYDLLLRAHEHGFIIENLSFTVLSYRVHPLGGSQRDKLRQALNKIYVKKMARYRKHGQFKKENELLRRLRNQKFKVGVWLKLVFNYRCLLLQKRVTKKDFTQHLYSLIIIILSVLHYKLILISYSDLMESYTLQKSFQQFD
jgi:glycosyltransferase involved in cell wall biosynthesis